jgi:hypothetical protein
VGGNDGFTGAKDSFKRWQGADLSYSLIDSQSVKTVSASDERGVLMGKKSRAANGIS